MRNYKIIACISDIHLGIKYISAKTFKKQLKKHFIHVLEDMKELDGIFILGDILHTIISLNSDAAAVYFWFIDRIYKIAKEKKAIVLIIKGTPSHDNDQLDNIKHYVDNDDGVDFRIYENIEEDTIFGDYKILALPDVRIKKNSDVEQYLTSDKKYDMILGHGMISTFQFVTQTSENMPSKTYIYDPDQLIDSCKGPVLFGHVHQYQSVRNHFYYVGPFTLLERGGVDAGFAVVGIYDKDRTKFKVEHFLNPDSANYYDLDISAKILSKFPIDEIIEAIDDILKDTKENDLITLRITRGDAVDSADKVYMLESRYRKDRRISIVKKVKSEKQEETEKKNEERKSHFSYIMEQSRDLSEIMYKYYLEEYKPTLPENFDSKITITEDTFRRILGEKKGADK